MRISNEKLLEQLLHEDLREINRLIKYHEGKLSDLYRERLRIYASIIDVKNLFKK